MKIINLIAAIIIAIVYYPVIYHIQQELDNEPLGFKGAVKDIRQSLNNKRIK